MRTIPLRALASLIGLVILTSATLANDQLTALEIARKAYDRDEGRDVTMEQKMILQKKGKSPRSRSVILIRLETDQGVEKSLLRFTEPADVRGTGFLVWSYPEAGKDDDQWLYLPALKRVRRIAAQERSRSFMGTDFTYDDLGDRKPDDDEHRLVGEEKVEGRDCYVIEATPKDEDYLYSRRIGWIEKGTFLLLKGEFYDRKGDLLKTFKASDIQVIDGIATPLRLEMTNVLKDHSTILELSNVAYNTGLTEDAFTQANLSNP